MPRTVAIRVRGRMVLLTDPSVPVCGAADAKDRVFHISDVPDRLIDPDVQRILASRPPYGPGREIPFSHLQRPD